MVEEGRKKRGPDALRQKKNEKTPRAHQGLGLVLADDADEVTDMTKTMLAVGSQTVKFKTRHIY
jgi:hypothetical protein